MSLNPFVALGSDPVGALALLGYGLFLLSLSMLATAYCWRTVLYLASRAASQSRWRIPLDTSGRQYERWKWVPPAGFTLRAASVPFVLAWTVWAIGGVIWLLAP